MTHWFDDVVRGVAAQRISRRSAIAQTLLMGASTLGSAAFPWRKALGQPFSSGHGIRLNGRTLQFGYGTVSAGLSLEHAVALQPNGAASHSIVLRRARAVWMEISLSHAPQKQAGPEPVQLTIRYGAPFSGIRSAQFRTTAAGLIEGQIDGRTIFPVRANADPRTVRFQDGAPPPRVTMASGAEAALNAIFQKAAREAPPFIRGAPSPIFRPLPSTMSATTSPPGHESHPGLSTNCIGALAGCTGIELGCLYAAFTGCAFLLFGAGICVIAASAICITIFAGCTAVALNSGPFCCPVPCGAGTGGTDNGCCDSAESCLDSGAPNGLCCSPGLRPCNNKSCCQASDTCMPNGSCCPQGLNTCATAGGIVCCDRGQVCQQPGVCCPPAQVVCAGACCSPDIHACNKGICCPDTQAVCNGICCPPGGGCDRSGNCCAPPSHLCGGVCCAPFSACCNDQCCGSDEFCVGGRTCCPRDRVCGPVCCPPGQSCQNAATGTCAPCRAGTVPCASPGPNGVVTTICCPPGANCCRGQCCTNQTGHECTGPGGSCGTIH